jgi:hypothetical protein
MFRGCTALFDLIPLPSALIRFIYEPFEFRLKFGTGQRIRLA